MPPFRTRFGARLVAVAQNRPIWGDALVTTSRLREYTAIRLPPPGRGERRLLPQGGGGKRPRAQAEEPKGDDPRRARTAAPAADVDRSGDEAARGEPADDGEPSRAAAAARRGDKERPIEQLDLRTGEVLHRRRRRSTYLSIPTGPSESRWRKRRAPLARSRWHRRAESQRHGS